MSAAVLFRRVSMNVVVSQGPNERAESGTQHPSAHVKCADIFMLNDEKSCIIGQGKAFGFDSTKGRKASIQSLQNSSASNRLSGSFGPRSGNPARLSRFPLRDTVIRFEVALNSSSAVPEEENTNSGPSPSARARTPNADVLQSDVGVGSTKQE